MEGFQITAGGTLPPSLVVTNLKPDIVVMDKTNKTAEISEHRIEIAYKLKSEKYEHFLTAITNIEPSVIPFKIGSNTGFISSRDRTTQKKHLLQTKQNIKLKQFINSISGPIPKPVEPTITNNVIHPQKKLLCLRQQDDL